MTRAFKDRNKIEKQAFIALAKKLWQRPLSLAECFCTMAKEDKKLRLNKMKEMLLKWQKRGVLEISKYGYVTLNFGPEFFMYAPADLIEWIANESVAYWLANAPHGLKMEGIKNERRD